MVTNFVHKNLIEGEDCLRTGLYGWIPTFEGDVKFFKDLASKSLTDINKNSVKWHLFFKGSFIIDREG